jgi:hypothetical protein
VSARRRRGPFQRLAVEARLGARRSRRQIRLLARRTRHLAWVLGRRAAVLAVLAAVSVGLGLAVHEIYLQYGFHPAVSTATWASLQPRYENGSECASCHGGEVAALASSQHASIDCQTCHGPAADHPQAVLAVSGPAASADPTQVTALCVTCHAAVDGRPTDFPTINTETHYAAPCALCHDPHDPTPLVPPVIRHSLDRLPDCLVCHGPDGLDPMPSAHPVWPGGDCLACHRQEG